MQNQNEQENKVPMEETKPVVQRKDAAGIVSQDGESLLTGI